MTRINCVPVGELHSKHLVAEYRELPRVFRLAEGHWAKHQSAPPKAPPQYSLGRGHVLFFYTRLGYCSERVHQLVAEMDRRGFRALFRTPPDVLVPAEWMALWYPTAEALNVNRERIKQRAPK